MHMADALVSPSVALAAGVAAAALIAVAARELKKSPRTDNVPLMGVMGAFVFAAQMINFSIPGTGSSGHIVGGVLLAALLGPWAGFLTLVSVIVVQCLVFADGGLLALGCNIVNMGAMTALVAYPLVFRPIMRRGASRARIVWASLLSCIIGLEAGALMVVAETELSGITALPLREFLGFMLPIHLAIGICEGVATASVLLFVSRSRPDLLEAAAQPRSEGSPRRIAAVFAALALILGGGLAFFASTDPDGLEWSVSKVAGDDGLDVSASTASREAESLQQQTSVMPDYDNALSGIIGSAMVLLMVWGGAALIMRSRRVAASRGK